MNTLERRTIGSALQRGLMTLSGYFDSHDCGGIHVDPWLRPADWAVMTFREYRGGLIVEGYNLNCAPGDYGHRFTWLFELKETAFSSWRYRFELCQGAEGVDA